MSETPTKERSASYGFTLVETLIAISILGILAIIAIPNFLNWIPHYRLKWGAREVYSNLQLARLRAVATNSQYGVTFNNATNDYCLVPLPSTHVCASQECCLVNNNPATKCYTDSALACSSHGLSSGITFGSASGALGPPSNPTTAVESDGITFPNNKVTFSPNGSSPDSGNDGTVYLKNGRNSALAITILNTTGRIRLWRLSEGTIDGWK